MWEGQDSQSPRMAFLGNLAAAGYTPGPRRFTCHCGGSDPRYAEIAIMSSSERFETTFFISAAAVPALDPFWMQMSCRAI